MDENQELVKENVNRASQVIQEHESVEHQATRSVVELQTVALGDQIGAEGEETRTLVLSSNNQMTLAMNRVIDQVQVVSDRVRAQALEHREVRGWVVAIIAQQARVIEAQAMAMKAANESSAKSSSKRLHKAFKKAQEGLQAALEVLITLADMFERVGPPHMVQL